MTCPYCGAEEIRELGYEDGGGDFGERVTLMLHCDICGETFEEYDMGFSTHSFDSEGQEGVTGNIGDVGVNDVGKGDDVSDIPF